jgi:predicted nuclease with TOPRIM domain
MADTSTRIEKIRTPDFQKFLDEVRALKNRLHSLELARLEEARQGALDASDNEAGRRTKGGSPEEVLKIQHEARRYVDAEHENSKTILAAKYDKFDSTLQALSLHLGDLAPLRELESRQAAEGERLKKIGDELRVRREVVAHEEEDASRNKDLLAVAESALRQREALVRSKLANLDVVRRAQELDRQKEELESKLTAYESEAKEIVRHREELNRDFDQLGQKRAELDRDAEALSEMREKLSEERKNMVGTVSREMAMTFESFIRDLLKQPGG